MNLRGKLRESPVRSDVGYGATQRRDGVLDLMENRRILSGHRDLVDLARQAAHRLVDAHQVFRRRQAAQRVAHLRQAVFEPGQCRRVHAGAGPGAAGAVDAFGKRADFGLQRLDGAAGHRIGQRTADLGQVAAQRGQGVFIGPMQRGDLRGDVAQVMLEAGQVRSLRLRAPCVCAGSRSRSWSRSRSRSRGWGRSAVERALARRNFHRPILRARRRRRRRGWRWSHCDRGRHWRHRRRDAQRTPLGFGRGGAAFGDDLVQAAIEPRNRFGDAVRVAA